MMTVGDLMVDPGRPFVKRQPVVYWGERPEFRYPRCGGVPIHPTLLRELVARPPKSSQVLGRFPRWRVGLAKSDCSLAHQLTRLCLGSTSRQRRCRHWRVAGL